MSVRLVVLMLVPAMTVRAAGRATPRFPTEEHKKFPLAQVHEYLNRGHTTRCVPYKPPDFVQGYEALWKAAIAKDFPPSEEAGDTVRHYLGIAHIHGAIPQGHREASVESVGHTFVHRIVFDASGRPKIAEGIRPDGPKPHRTCVLYDGERRVVLVGRFFKGKLSSGMLCDYAREGVTWDLKAAPIRIVDMTATGRVVGCREYEGGRRVRSIALPDPAPLEPGKWPCQARRYYHELKALLAAPALTDEQRVQAIVTYTKYEPLAREERWRGGFGYTTLRSCAVESLGELHTKAARDALVKLLGRRDLRATAARTLGKSKDSSVLPSLLKALEQEDAEARGRPFNSAERNRHLVTGQIIRAMLQLAPDKAKGMLEAFVKEKERVFRSTVERSLQ